MKSDSELHFPKNSDGSLVAFAWPGGYTLIYFRGYDEVLCASCATKAELTGELTSYDIYWEGPTIYCEECNDEIESAYGDPEKGE